MEHVRGKYAESGVEFLTDFNSYFDHILVDWGDVVCCIVGTMARPASLFLPLSMAWGKLVVEQSCS